jgi:transcriptional regulator with XRE-family HTH domain
MRSRESRVVARASVFRALAAQRNQTLDEFAKTLGIAERHFYRLLRGKVSPSPATRAAICEALELPFDELFEFEDPNRGIARA